MLAQIATLSAGTLFDSRVQIGARSVQCREEAEYETRQDRYRQREHQHAPVHADTGAVQTNPRNVAGIDGEERSDANHAEREAEDAADE